ncbi:MAG: UDP-N-acetylglucosamine-1-phosphate transferase [Candidatus Methanoperedens sp.]|nr:UDP-N-acetylglucosamine-1-phosphate transferase [Candidatus Methanoperedens sp.]MCZ7359822.1 UDP-N-acetylglucosamine-1-phosphate transferase [Candidatus Methanoperedens sp.]HLB72013.1 UDP-N-acetylglucosamine-1-phosphate transferase [Candidatus Methanoperedens sp.]
MNSIYWLILEIALVFLLPFFIILISTPYLIRELTRKGFVVKDFHKKGNKMIPTGGGLAIILTALFSISINSLFYDFEVANYVGLNVIILFSMFGILDDMIDIGRPAKLVLMYFFSFPLMSYTNHSEVLFPLIGSADYGIFYGQLIVPTFVLVAANLVNMHSGFNGMSSGLSVIILFSLIIKSLMTGNIDSIVAIIAITGATLGFHLFERYPSRIFWGNIGSLTVGAAIGVLIVMQGFIFSGFIMLLPHTINFLMYVYWRVKKYPQAKFGRVREDGTLEVPNNLTLKWVLPYYRRVTERQATYAMYAVTAVFGIIGILIPG